MSAIDPDIPHDEDHLEKIHETIRHLAENFPETPFVKGTVVSVDTHKKRPIGLLILANPKNPNLLKHLLVKFQPTDFKLSLPLKLSKILYRLSTLNREVRRLRKQIMIDEMTGMYNYRFFKKQLKTEIARSKRTGLPCSLILLDIDRFKRINDTHGHLIGNEIIKEIAKRISKSIRSIDYSSRYGGDEFAIILPSTGLQEAIGIAERVRNTVASNPIQLPNLPALPVTVSGGVAEFSDLFYTTMNSLIEAADKALYQAKMKGRNRIGYFEEELAKITGIGLGPEEKDLLLTPGKDDSTPES